MEHGKNATHPNGNQKGFSRIVLIVSFALSLIPLAAYLLLPALPESLPVKYDSMGIPSINVPKFSFDMIFFSLEGVLGFFIMLLVDKIARGFARRTYRNKNDLSSTDNTMSLITLVISLLLNVSWFLTIIPLLL
ncbi:MAG: hypothetical protein IKZ21_01520 [Clostridia bacterium]|nr:hypothetical protein [Clostridia bacterium]